MHHFLSSLSSRSLGMTLGNTSWLKQMYIDALKDGSSVVAVDKEGKLMGVRVGKVTRCSRDGRPSLYVSVFSSSQESRLGSLVWGQNDSGCRQSDISLAKGGWIQCRLSKLVANKLLSVLSWLIFMKSCFFFRNWKSWWTSWVLPGWTSSLTRFSQNCLVRCSKKYYQHPCSSPIFSTSRCLLYNDKTRGHITIINIEVMYDDKAVCSARWHGVKGLGTELVRWSK